MPAQIILADADISSRSALKDILEAVGYTVAEASSGEETLQRYNPHTHLLAIVDAYLPDITGVDLAAALMRVNPDVQILFASEGQDVVAVEEAAQLGLDKWLYKPFAPKAVIQAVATALEHPRQAEV